MKKLLFFLVALMVASVSVAQKKNNVNGKAAIEALFESQVNALKAQLTDEKDCNKSLKGYLDAHGIVVDIPVKATPVKPKGASHQDVLDALNAEIALVQAENAAMIKAAENHKCTETCKPNNSVVFDEQGHVYVSVPSVVKSSVKFTAPEIKKDDGTIVQMSFNEGDADEEVETFLQPASMKEMVKFKTRTCFNDGKKSTLFVTNCFYIPPAEKLERFASRFFFRDSTSSTLQEAAEKYSLTLGKVEESSRLPADATLTFDMRLLGKFDGYLYWYELSYEKIADGKKRSNSRRLIYDATSGRVLQLEDVVIPSVAEEIRNDAGRAFINMTISPKGTPLTVSYKKDKELKQKALFLSSDQEKLMPAFLDIVSSAKMHREAQISKAISEGRVFDVVEQMPEFPGGQAALLRWISENVKYPATAEENGIQGRVVCTFVVECDGSVTEVQAARSVHPSLDNEAVRVLSMMPKWKPGTQNAKPVRVKYTVPVTFHLIDNTPKKKK